MKLRVGGWINKGGGWEPEESALPEPPKEEKPAEAKSAAEPEAEPEKKRPVGRPRKVAE
jgi:hypothetical protein